MKAIQLKDVWEQYRIKFVREKRVFWEHIWALQGLNLEIEKGECVGIIGENGAGKTTLLKVVAGMLCPDRGEVNVAGRVSCLMELGTGFHPELTGRENIFLNAGLYGLSRDEIDARFNQIAEFAGIGKFIDAVVKSYSQGMYMRLAFSLAIHIEPDILLIDDILAVGDEDAQIKCANKIFELKEKGATIIFVTHNLDLLTQFCSRAVLLKKGRIIKDGPSGEAAMFYLDAAAIKETASNEEAAAVSCEPVIQGRHWSIKKGNLQVSCDPVQKQIKFYYKDKEITGGNGIYTGLCSNNYWYHSFDSSWQIEKQSWEKIQLILKYPQISLTQFWQIELGEADAISLNIKMDVLKNTVLTAKDIRLELDNGYTQWVTDFEEGGFNDGEYIDKIKPVRLKNNKALKAGLKAQPDKQLPWLIFDSSCDGFKRNLSLYKRINFGKENINLQSLQIIPGREQSLAPGKYPYFKGMLLVNQGLEASGEALSTSNKIEAGRLSIIFDEGRSKIFYEGKELTVGLGMYTSLRSSGIWYDSYQAVWDVEQISNRRITAVGSWPYIPVSQRWQIEVLDEAVVSWQVEMHVYNQFKKLELLQANLMLNSLYKEWAALDGSRGIFLNEFGGDYDISPYRFWYGPAKASISVFEKNLPQVSFFANGAAQHFRAIIGNTDNIYKARLLQYQKAGPPEFNGGKYFEGIIKIGKNE